MPSSDSFLQLAPIPAGSFIMGSPNSETGRHPQEGPQTQVTLTRSFWMAKTSVTVGQWKEIMGTGLLEQAAAVLADDTAYDFWEGKRMILRDFYQKKRESDPASLLSNTDENAPMHFVNWEEGREFCRRLNERERARLPAGYEYRFPTDAEREYACRGGDDDGHLRGRFGNPNGRTGSRPGFNRLVCRKQRPRVQWPEVEHRHLAQPVYSDGSGRAPAGGEQKAECLGTFRHDRECLRAVP
jgi:formylglycine-generating enzyme required for sulfatase activity